MTREERVAIIKECHNKVTERLGGGSDYIWERIYESALLLSGSLDVVRMGEGAENATAEEVIAFHEKGSTSDILFPFIHKLLMEME